MGQSTPTAGSGTLFIVATPIGNLGDITYRAVEVLKSVALVAAEDTRHSRKLLDYFGINVPLLSCYDHNERDRLDLLLARLADGDDVALVSDAGTPGIADPGYRLVQACHAAGVKVVPIPGPSAVITALCAAGVPIDRFAFEGYLPAKAKARLDLLQSLRFEPRTLVFYETPHRLVKALQDMQSVLGAERPLVVARELTKLYEEFYRGTVQGALDHFGRERVRGELVVILPPVATQPAEDPMNVLRELLADGKMTRSEAVKLVAREYGLPRSDVYKASLDLVEKDDRDD